MYKLTGQIRLKNDEWQPIDILSNIGASEFGQFDEAIYAARHYCSERYGYQADNMKWTTQQFPYVGTFSYIDHTDATLWEAEFKVWDMEQVKPTDTALLTVWFVDGTSAEIQIPSAGAISHAPRAENGHSFRILSADGTTYTFNWLQIKYFAISQEAKAK